MSEETRRGFLKQVLGGITLLTTPSFAQEAISANELVEKVKSLIAEKKFEDAIMLTQTSKGYEKLEAECHKDYAAHLKTIAVEGMPASKIKELEAITDKAINEYTLAFKDETLFKTAEHRAERASLLVGRNRYDEAISDYSHVVITLPKHTSGYAGIVDAKLRKGESDTLSKIFSELNKEHPAVMDATTLIKGSAMGTQHWFGHTKKHGGTIQHGPETIAFFSRMNDIFTRSWMNYGRDEQGNNKTVDERLSAKHRNEALFCLYVAGAAIYASQPEEVALVEYDNLVKPRYELMKQHLEGNLIESDKFAPQYLIKINFRNKDELFRQLRNRTKK